MLRQQQQDRLHGNRKKEATPKEIPITLYVYGSYPLDVGSGGACWDAAAQSTASSLHASSCSQNIWHPWSLDVGVCVRVKLVCCFIFLRFVCTLWERCSPASGTADRVSDIDNLLGYATGLFFCRLGSPGRGGFERVFCTTFCVCVYFVLFARKGKSTRTGRTSRRQVEGLYDSLMTFDCLLMLAALFVPPSRSPGIDTPSYGTRRDQKFQVAIKFK